MTAIDDRARELGDVLGAPLGHEITLANGFAYRPYYNAVLVNIPGAGVYCVSEATVANLFLPSSTPPPVPPATGLLEGIDVASYQPRDLTGLINGCAPRPAHVVVHLYMGAPYESVDQDHTREQIRSAWANGCTAGGYYFGYPGNDPRESVKRALDVANSVDGYWPPVLWLDVETSDWGMVGTAWIGYAVEETRNQGAVPGIYTAKGMWDQLGDPHTFADVHLWNALWNDRHDLLMAPPYGGWSSPSAGHQWGVVDDLDRNVFAGAVCGAGGGSAPGLRDQIIAVAAGYAGVPYQMPPDDETFDCSSYVLRVFAEVGLPFPSGVRTAEQERQACAPIGWSELLPGDLVFFEHTYEPSEPPGPDGHVASHVGISLGAGSFRMWNAVEPVVEETDISTSYWQRRLLAAGRPPGL